MAAGLAWWLFEKFDAPVWLVLITLFVCLASVVLVRWLEQIKIRRNLFVLFLVLYASFAIFAAIRFREPTASTAPSQPPPKVNEKQTESDQKDVSNIDPAYLVGLYKKYSSAQADEAVKPYLGKPVQISGTVKDVYKQKVDGRDAASVLVRVDQPDGSFYIAWANFTDERSVRRALIFGRGEGVTIVGTIGQVSDSGLNLGQSAIIER